MAVRWDAIQFLQDGRHNGRRVYKAPGRPAPKRPRGAFEVTREDIRELRAFVRCLFDTPRQTVDDAWARQKLVAHLGGNGRGSSEQYQYSQSGIVRSDFSSHLTRLANAAALWFEGGEIIPPILAERVQLFLRRSGRLKWEKAFLAVFCYHFAVGHNGRYDGLVTRATELRVYPLPRRAAKGGRPISRRIGIAARSAA